MRNYNMMVVEVDINTTEKTSFGMFNDFQSSS